MLNHPVLVGGLYKYRVGGDFNEDGASELNRKGYNAIGYQRAGAEWVVRGLATGHPDWIELGWRMLDWGLARQTPQGDFLGAYAYYSTIQFIEALARCAILDPQAATADRLDKLKRAAAWQIRPDIEKSGFSAISPYTHRYYILAAGLGQTAKLTGDKVLARYAENWAWRAVKLQTVEGVNPEAGGFDASYQMVGILFAMRYLPVCSNPELSTRIRSMAGRAVKPVLERLTSSGEINAADSTRMGHEFLPNGKPKTVNYPEVIQALVYAAICVPDTSLLAPAQILSHRLYP